MIVLCPVPFERVYFVSNQGQVISWLLLKVRLGFILIICSILRVGLIVIICSRLRPCCPKPPEYPNIKVTTSHFFYTFF